ncbi:MAG: Nif3-like dinuclear metal center hexameric protein [Bacteroidota bacterium]
MKVQDIIQYLERWAPLAIQEPYDNAGLIIGDKNDESSGGLITLDVTEAVIKEAVQHNCNLIIAHHPLIFNGIKKIGRSSWMDKCINLAIKHDINIYAVHTNLDNVLTGVNDKICDLIGLGERRILLPKPGTLAKLTVFVPPKNKHSLLEALFSSGAGDIGNYDHCTFEVSGLGSFRGNELSNPTLGKKGQTENVKEDRIEVILRKHDADQILKAMKNAHPYEEVAYYLTDLLNENQSYGSGMVGVLPKPLKTTDFFQHLKSVLKLQVIRHTEYCREVVSKVAVCGGSGSFLLEAAKKQNADVFITADFKYHEFFGADDRIIIADVGHYESEVWTKDLLHERLSKVFANFAFRLSRIDTNPIKYL